MRLSPMASKSFIPLLFLLLLTTAASAAGINTAASATFQEHEAMLRILRSHGYTLFTNAITTSDLQYQLLTAAENASASAVEMPISEAYFTLFAPIDELLFALDMSSDADAYVRTLRYHVVPNRRHTYDDLRNLSSPFLETLLPHYSVLIGKIRGGGRRNSPGNATVGVMVDGVRLSNPDLFLGSRISVHGIDGILLTALNLNHQFDRNHNGSELSAPAGSVSAAKGTPHPINSTAAPTTHLGGNKKAPPPEAVQDKAEKISAGKKKLKNQGICRRRDRACHRRNHRGHHRRSLEDL